MDNYYLDASAVISLYKISGKKHLFITGNRGSGKSCLMNDITNLMSCSFNYLKSWRTDDPNPCVVIKSNIIDNGKESIIGVPRSLTPDSSCKGSTMRIVEEGFLNCAIPAIQMHLKNDSDKLFIIDELGYLETSCTPFQEAVYALLDQSHVFAVIRKQSTEFLNKISSRDDVLLINIDNTFNSLSCIIMASGISKRFGSNKLLADFRGLNLFENALSESCFVKFGNILAVTRHQEIADICYCSGIDYILHSLPYRNDMIRLGVSHTLETAKTDGILFLPSDQPLISRTSMQLLCLAFLYYKDKICRLSFNGTAGSPVIFPSRYYDELLTLPEGKGGGFLTKKYPEQVILIPAQDEYELFDIDTPDDLTHLLQYCH